MERYICIHGHFYQPPRENPWLEAIELQDSAYPYHDWNHRINAECYAPNSSSRILDDEGRIRQIVNNYSRISFNFGPTLLSWLESEAPDIYQAILEADRQSQNLFPGHGSAIAQAYNHMIMPLANRRDKDTQVIWGIHDFERRFGRAPEGMWLPETAVDLETLDTLAEYGVKFTVLAPRQARRVRQIGGRAWRDVQDGRIDPTMPYLQRLPSGRSITLFFYDGPISQGVAFEGLLTRGENLANRLLGAFSADRTWPQIIHIATDGETYGHHHRFGDMALARAMEWIETDSEAQLTNYGQHLEKHLPTHQVEIVENTSWSCVHGIERWRSDCGCNTGGHQDWNQSWRAPLRQALDWLRDTLTPIYEQHAAQYLNDPWDARNDYISVILDRSAGNVDDFISRHARNLLSDKERVRVLKLLELQRQLLLMYTSCGWFFDELSGIETSQVIQYAGRAVQLAEELFGDSVEESFLERLEDAKSNLPEHRDGRVIYAKFVKAAAVDLSRVSAHYAVSSLFNVNQYSDRVYCYRVEREDYQLQEAGEVKLAVGRAKIASEITHEEAEFNFGVLHFGDHNLAGGVTEAEGGQEDEGLNTEITEAFRRSDFADVIRHLDRAFGASIYSLRTLFRDEQRKILDTILQSMQEETENAYRQIYEHHAPLMRFLVDLNVPIPETLLTVAETAMNIEVRRSFQEETLNLDRARFLFSETTAWHLELDVAGLSYTIEQTLARLAERFQGDPADTEALKRFEAVSETASTLPFELNLWKPQNSYYRVLQVEYPFYSGRAAQGEAMAQEWVEHFASLGNSLRVRVE